MLMLYWQRAAPLYIISLKVMGFWNATVTLDKVLLYMGLPACRVTFQYNTGLLTLFSDFQVCMVCRVCLWSSFTVVLYIKFSHISSDMQTMGKKKPLT